MKPAVAGSLFATVTGLTWGGQFVVGKSALGHADAFHLNTVRYGIAAAVLLLLLTGARHRCASDRFAANGTTAAPASRTDSALPTPEARAGATGRALPAREREVVSRPAPALPP